MLLRKLTPACDRHGCGRHGVDPLVDGLTVRLVRLKLVRVTGRVAEFYRVEASLSDRVGVVAPGA